MKEWKTYAGFALMAAGIAAFWWYGQQAEDLPEAREDGVTGPARKPRR